MVDINKECGFKIAELINNNKRVVVMTGAGMSVSSGLPTYMGRDGIYRNGKLLEIYKDSSQPAFIDHYRHLVEKIQGSRPSKGHEILKELVRDKKIKRVITQNIDGYHGKHKVIELHGNLDTFVCKECGARYSASDYLTRSRCRRTTFSKDTWAYEGCGGSLRPDVVLFGETPRGLTESLFEMYTCDVLIVLGTSLHVSPANTLPEMAKEMGAHLLLATKDPIEATNFDDVFFGIDADKVLQYADIALRIAEARTLEGNGTEKI